MRWQPGSRAGIAAAAAAAAGGGKRAPRYYWKCFCQQQFVMPAGAQLTSLWYSAVLQVIYLGESIIANELLSKTKVPAARPPPAPPASAPAEPACTGGGPSPCTHPIKTMPNTAGGRDC